LHRSANGLIDAGNRYFQAETMSQISPGLPADAEQIDIAGFNRFVGPLYRLPDGENGALKRYAFLGADRHMNSAGSIHGGMLMTFMDVAMSRTSRVISGAKSCSTVSLSCDFVGPGRNTELIEAQVRVSRQTRTMVFMSGQIAAGGRVLLVANGLWKIVA
jgi:acyl-coenzyme A thioesterase PaaI-like protein